MPKQPPQTERVVFQPTMRSGVRTVKSAEVEAEVDGYPEGSWKRDSAKNWFQDNYSEVPAALVQKLEWAQSVLADAEGALLEWALHCTPEAPGIRRVIEQLQVARDSRQYDREVSGEPNRG